MRYKKKNLKILVVPHYSGSVKTSEVFKRIITEQIEKKLSKKIIHTEKYGKREYCTLKRLAKRGQLMYNKDVE